MTEPGRLGGSADWLWDPEELRRRASELIGDEALEGFDKMSEADFRALTHELRVHQLELEMQNDELRRALVERDAALDKYTDLYDFAPTGLLAVDMEGTVLEANLTAAALLSVYRGTLVGSSLQSYFTPASIREFRDFREDIVATGARRSCELEGRTSDGRRRFFRLDGLAFVPGGEEEGRIRAALTDITDRHEMEEALRESEEHFRSVVEGAGDAIITVDESGAVVFWNPAATRMFGHTFDEMRGRSVTVVMPEAFHDLHTTALARAASEGSPPLVGRPMQGTGTRENGEEFPLELTLTRWHTDSAVFLTGIVRDRSERKRAQEEQEVLHDRLRQALKMEAIGRLAGGVAHDMNNMLTPILGYAEMLLADTPAEDPRRVDVVEIAAAARRARALTRQLLAFARKQTLEIRIVDLNAVIEGFERMLRRMLRENVVLDLRLGELSGAVEGDVGQLEQVLLNLAINAQDAMPHGGTLTVETAEANVVDDGKAEIGSEGQAIAPGSYVVLTLTDDGHGMPPEVRERVFEPFYTSKLAGHGTGLGLATVYGIVRQHGGDISVKSGVGRGTEFKIYLPRVEEYTSTGLKVESERPLQGTETVLVVEDQEQVLRLAARALRRHGYTVLEASDGEQALEVAAAHEGPLQLLLSDVVMPGMSGPDLASRLQEERPDLPVLYMSGYTGGSMTADTLLRKDAALLHKPFSATELANRVRELLED